MYDDLKRDILFITAIYLLLTAVDIAVVSLLPNVLQICKLLPSRYNT